MKILQVHAEDGDKGNPREVRYGLVSENNPFTSFFDINDTSGKFTNLHKIGNFTGPVTEATEIDSMQAQNLTSSRCGNAFFCLLQLHKALFYPYNYFYGYDNVRENDILT